MQITLTLSDAAGAALTAAAGDIDLSPREFVQLAVNQKLERMELPALEYRKPGRPREPKAAPTPAPVDFGG